MVALPQSYFSVPLVSSFSLFPLVVVASASDFPKCIFVVAPVSSAYSKPTYSVKTSTIYGAIRF